MFIANRLLLLGSFLGLVAALGLFVPPALPVAARAPAAQPRPPALTATPTADPELPLAMLATATRTPTPINVGNFVWSDTDGDGRQDAGEPGLSGVQVQLWNNTKTALIDTATTNASGLYSLTAPAPGTYRVRVLLPVSSIFSPKDNASDDLTDSDINPSGADFGFTDGYVFGSNLISITTIDAGIRPPPGSPTPTRTPTPINVGNFVWNDINGNGFQDTSEPGLSGIQVQLWNEAKTALLDTAFTNANGNYSLVAPTPGTYRVRVLKPTGSVFSPKDAGGDDQKDSDINPGGTDTGFTDGYVFGSNLISITTIDAGLTSVPATPTMTATVPVTPTPARSRGRAYLPLLIK
ncbi:MAG TPA: SdrD B-like domain-containing protein [Herpetosiphonaceae bacterium]|nr:SdrD B-like domain-containing protein [Herpetosiphonaceae bacterium]